MAEHPNATLFRRAMEAMMDDPESVGGEQW